MSGLFTRDGHVTGLTLERMAHDELERAERAPVDDHLRRCDHCQQRAGRVAAPAALPAPRVAMLPSALAPPPDLPDPANAAGWSARAALGVGLAIAAAAVVAVGLPQREGQEVFHARGAELGLEVFRKATGPAEVLVEGSEVRAGETIGFRLFVPQDGWVLLAGVDGMREVYPVWPPAPPHEAQRVRGSAEPRGIDAAIQLDATPGDEKLVLVSCDAPFSLQEVGPDLAVQRRHGCATKTVTLRKVP